MGNERRPWHGVHVATALPLHDDLSVDFDGYAEHVRWLGESGVDGITPNGSLGEYQTLSDDERAVFVRAFERTGFTGGIDWYRNMTGNWERAEALEQRVDAPALMITAELDAALPPSLAEPMRAHVADLESHELAGVGHWSQQEAPAEVNRLILGWLDRRFPQRARAA